MQIKNIATYLAQLLSPQQLTENLKYTQMKEDGLRFGDGVGEATGILVCWMATHEAIQAALDSHCNVIICHEDLYFQSFDAPLELSAGWLANRGRLRLLLENGLNVFRCHSPLDVLFTTDAALEVLRLEVRSLHTEWIARVAAVSPLTVASIAECARRGFEVSQVKVIGDLTREVRHVGVSVGGMGLSCNGSFQEWLRRCGAEVIVTGEVDEYGAFWAMESGVAMIAVGHAACENPGLRRFTDRLRKDFPDVPAHFHECRLNEHTVLSQT